jgi:(p)ppGpp synthase/HD superfamily hydrolase
LRAILSKDGSRVIACEWVVPEGTKYKARIEVILGDRIGILHEVTGLITNMGVNIADIGPLSQQGSKMILHMAVDVSGSAELAALISRIEAVRDVVSVRRIAH